MLAFNPTRDFISMVARSVGGPWHGPSCFSIPPMKCLPVGRRACLLHSIMKSKGENLANIPGGARDDQHRAWSSTVVSFGMWLWEPEPSSDGEPDVCL